jgi:hypothetical protein
VLGLRVLRKVVKSKGHKFNAGAGYRYFAPAFSCPFSFLSRGCKPGIHKSTRQL